MADSLHPLAAALATFALAGSAVAAPDPTHCARGEETVFNCSIGSKRVSVCALPGAPPRAAYRFGKPGAVELSLPAAGGPGPMFSSTAYSGGGEAHLRFHNEGYDYILFDRTVRTNFTPGEPNDPDFSAGLVVRKDGRTLSTALCRGDAAISAFAYEKLPREDFEDLDLPSP